MMLPNVASAKTWRAMKRVKRNMMNVTKKRQCWRRMRKKTTEMRLFIGSARALTVMIPSSFELILLERNSCVGDNLYSTCK